MEHANANVDMLYCHHCRQKRPENIVKPCTNQVDPKGVPCTKRYCKSCFDRFYPGLYDKVQLSESWACPYCSAYCCCTRCNNKKYTSYPPQRESIEEEYDELTSDATVPEHSEKEIDRKDYTHPVGMEVRYRPKKRMKTVKAAEAVESDPAWGELSLKYLQYAKKLAQHSSIPIESVRQLPSITHMIAISNESGLEEGPWRWCDAYHAIKYLKDHGMVTTSRGAKGTSIKDEHSSIDDLIVQLQERSSLEVNQQGEYKYKDLTYFQHPQSSVHVAVEHVPGNSEVLEFNMRINDLVSEDHLYERIKMLIMGMGLHGSDTDMVCAYGLKLRLLGYTEKSGEFIHANMYTSVPELIQEATKIRVTVT